MKCLGCGATNPEGTSQCNFCGKVFSAAPVTSPVTRHENEQVAKPVDPEQEGKQETSATSPANYSDLSKWYQDVFTKFDNDSATGLKMKFSWPPFLFGPFWYLSKGLWAKALIYIAIALVSGGTLAIFAWIYTSIFGIYDYYLLKKFGKQLW